MHMAGTVQGDLAAEGLPKELEADGEVGDQLRLGVGDHPRRDAPGQEFRIAADVRDDVEKLFPRVGLDLLFGMRRHQAAFSRASRAARSSAKSRSA